MITHLTDFVGQTDEPNRRLHIWLLNICRNVETRHVIYTKALAQGLNHLWLQTGVHKYL